MTGAKRQQLRAAIDAARRAKTMTANPRACAGCGCDYDTRTPGCRTCTWRHSDRKRCGYRTTRACVGCGCHLDDYTARCVTCRERAKGRRRRQKGARMKRLVVLTVLVGAMLAAALAGNWEWGMSDGGDAQATPCIGYGVGVCVRSAPAAPPAMMCPHPFVCLRTSWWEGPPQPPVR